MSGIGRKKGDTPQVATETVDGLIKEFNETVDKIRKILNGKKEKSMLSEEEKRNLRTEYLRASFLAKKIHTKSTDDKLIDQYKELSKKLAEKAEEYGSVMKRSIPTTTLDDVKGLNEVKALVKTFLFMAQNPQILAQYNMKGGLGMMMYGAPGTGKTMIAEAIANEMKLPLFIVTPADIFKSYVGESEAAVKQLFQEIETCEDGAILFVDECESIFGRRSSETKDYKIAVTNELLQRINGFGVDGSKRILIGATNRPDMIDPAYLRYKRFSYLIHITPPDKEAKRAIIDSKLKNIPLENGLDVDTILAMTEKVTVRETPTGFVEQVEGYYSAADICGIIEEACRLAIEDLVAENSTQAKPLTRTMFEKAFSKIPPSITPEGLKAYEEFRKDLDF